ncbi:MAG: helix-turn-helix domain-containing protein [Candidatus Margulisbacteria bacterium]|nr:helix-turn-helix domain-containing protein [Candidatus Margulisiibacteriota bacterium]
MGLNVKQLVKMSGVSEGTISGYERGNMSRSDQGIYAISKALKVSPIWLIYGDDNGKLSSTGKKLRYLRRKKCLTVKQVSKKIRVATSTINSWERDVDIPKNSVKFNKMTRLLNR